MNETLKTVLEVVSTLASVSVPFVLAWAAHHFQRRQKAFEAVMSEKVRHYGTISPLLNVIFSYRFRVGDFLDRTPESVLEAKRKADQQFWTFEYLWSDDFRRAYHQFMSNSFRVFGKEGEKALIRVDGVVHPVKPTTQNWEAFTGEAVDRGELARLYGELKAAVAHDLGFKGYTTAMTGDKG
jgi:hypothetical protein